MESKWLRTLNDSKRSTQYCGVNVEINSSTGGEPAIKSIKLATTVRIKLMTWFFVSAEKNPPTASNTPAVKKEANSPEK